MSLTSEKQLSPELAVDMTCRIINYDFEQDYWMKLSISIQKHVPTRDIN